MKVRATDGISVVNRISPAEYEQEVRNLIDHSRFMRKQGKHATYARNVYDTKVHIPRWTAARLVSRSRAYRVGRSIRKALSWKLA